MRALAVAIALVLAGVVSLGAHPVQADPSPPPSPTPRADDIVILKNGTMLRGTVTEAIPGRSVRILLVSGETRVVDGREISYVGPASAMPPAGGAPPAGPPPPSALIGVDARRVHLRLEAAKGDITFYVRDTAYASPPGESRTVSQAYRRVCMAPCEASLPSGSYVMALSKGTGEPVDVDDPVTLSGDSTLQGQHTSYLAMRVVGTIITIGSVVGGLALIVSGLLPTKEDCETVNQQQQCTNTMDVNTDLVIGGSVLLVGGIIVGQLMHGKSDGATITLVPTAPGAAAAWRQFRTAGISGADRQGFSTLVLPGLSLAASF